MSSIVTLPGRAAVLSERLSSPRPSAISSDDAPGPIVIDLNGVSAPEAFLSPVISAAPPMPDSTTIRSLSIVPSI